jgi:release factor glutamine methyltransferase
MKTLLEVVKLSTAYLKEIGVPKHDAEELIAHALKLKRIELYLYHDKPLNESELAICRELVKKRATGTPTAYIAGEVTFATCRIKVTPAVLIPRPETEILVEKIAQDLAKEEREGKTLVDMCTGSGCIAIALKKRFPELNVIATDISKEALILAKENAALNEVAITFLEGDLFEPLSDLAYDYFVSNPPYVTPQEHALMDQQEPKLALIGGDSGLEFYKKIALRLKARLAWLEMGTGQGATIQSLFGNSTVEKDWAGHDRFLFIKTSN